LITDKHLKVKRKNEKFMEKLTSIGILIPVPFVPKQFSCEQTGLIAANTATYTEDTSVFLHQERSWCLRLLILVLCLAGFITAAQATVVIYPAPGGVDMATGVRVTANGQTVPVYSFPCRQPSGSGCFCQFDFSDSVKITVSSVPMNTELRPLFPRIKFTNINGTLTFTLFKPTNVFIPGMAFIFANGIESNQPRQEDANVIYYGPGISSLDTITLMSNQTLYLAGGAYVTAQLRVNNASNVKIMGRGILVTTSGIGITFNNCNNVLLSGIVQINTPVHGWAGNLRHSRDLKIINFKELGARDYSTDGTNLTNSSNVLFESCVWCCDDDCIAIKGDTRDLPDDSMTVKNCLMYSSNGGCMTIGTETVAQFIANLTVRNCDMYFDDRFGSFPTGKTGKGPINIASRYATFIRNLTYDNIDIWTNRLAIQFYFVKKIYGVTGNMSYPGGIDGIKINNVRVIGPGTKNLVLSGLDTNHKIINVNFSNIVLDGKCVTSISDPHFNFNQYTENITITGCESRASAFDPAINRIALIEPYSSYQSIVINQFYKPSFVYSIVPGALKAYDLPDLSASLAPRKLMMAGVTDGNGNKTDQESIEKDLEIIKTAYKSKNASEQLSIVLSESTEKQYNLFLERIK